MENQFYVETPHEHWPNIVVAHYNVLSLMAMPIFSSIIQLAACFRLFILLKWNLNKIVLKLNETLFI